MRFFCDFIGIEANQMIKHLWRWWYLSSVDVKRNGGFRGRCWLRQALQLKQKALLILITNQWKSLIHCVFWNFRASSLLTDALMDANALKVTVVDVESTTTFGVHERGEA
jgi:hypothetical protein